MEKQIVNPYLPMGNYFPDGEPRVFGDRVYLYASQDKFNATRYCAGDYVIWSAPVDDLSAWRKESVYKRKGSKGNKFGFRCMWAPDCTKGADGRYYLYYCFDFRNFVNVAVSDTPGGPFEFYGKVRHPDGKLYGKGKKDIMCFDPAVFTDEDGQTYLYSGYSANEDLRAMLRWKGIINADGTGGQVIKLEKDMLTVKGDPKMLIPGYKNSAGTGFEGHEMYEASSLRKVDGKYYFIYSSRLSHELAYAVSDYPDRDFKYGGPIVSNGNVGYEGLKEKDAAYYWGNNHGAIEKINGKWYVFYHKQTNKTEQCRQGCAEPIEILPDGSIKQVEMTSQGLNGKPLVGKGYYGAYIACTLQSKEGAVKCAYGPFSRHKYGKHPCITQENGEQYIQNMQNGARAGFKYFYFQGAKIIDVKVRGSGGTLKVSTEPHGEVVAQLTLHETKKWTEFSSYLSVADGVQPLYFTYEGEGKIDFLGFTIS